jgi:hypothetical protein
MKPKIEKTVGIYERPRKAWPRVLMALALCVLVILVVSFGTRYVSASGAEVDPATARVWDALAELPFTPRAHGYRDDEQS